MQWIVNDLREGYRQIVSDVIEFGRPVAPRGQLTHEVLGATIILRDPRDSLPYGIGRKFSAAIAAAEALQLIGGVSHPELMASIGRFREFQDGGTFHGAYGPRVRHQLHSVARRLQRDPDTRQAVVTIWDPAYDAHTDGLRDYPCTLSLHFMVRDDALDLHVTMRSNDVWWGLAHDVFQFTQLQQTMAAALGFELGQYYHHANSLHFYERDREQLQLLHPYEHHERTVACGLRNFDHLDRSMMRARDILAGDTEAQDEDEAWYIGVLGRYLV